MTKIKDAIIISHFINTLDISAGLLKGAEIDAMNIDNGQYLDGLNETIRNLKFLSDELYNKLTGILEEEKKAIE